MKHLKLQFCVSSMITENGSDSSSESRASKCDQALRMFAALISQSDWRSAGVEGGGPITVVEAYHLAGGGLVSENVPDAQRSDPDAKSRSLSGAHARILCGADPPGLRAAGHRRREPGRYPGRDRALSRSFA